MKIKLKDVLKAIDTTIDYVETNNKYNHTNMDVYREAAGEFKALCKLGEIDFNGLCDNYRGELRLQCELIDNEITAIYNDKM